MQDLINFLSNYGVWETLMIIAAGVIILLKMISGGKNLWAKRTAFQEAARKLGAQEQKQVDREREVEEQEEKRIADLETSVAALGLMLDRQQQQISLLIRSDELDIKAWIQSQHEKWITLQCIDSQSLDLVLQRYAIYAEEGGNGWAKKMVEDIRALPVVTVIPVPTEQR